MNGQSNNSPYYYVPVTKDGQLRLESIKNYHIEQFCHCLNTSKRLQRWIYTNRQSIYELDIKQVSPFFSKTTDVSIFSKNINSDIIVKLSTYFNIHDENTIKSTSLTKTKSFLPAMISVGGGKMRSVLFWMSSMISNISSGHKSTFTSPRVEVHFKHGDKRRIINGVIFTDIDQRCMIKSTNVKNYIAAYRQEADVYKHFQNVEERVCTFYGGIESKAKLSKENKTFTFDLNIDLKGKCQSIKLAFVNDKLKRNRIFYSLLTKWDIDFCTLERAMKDSRKNTPLRNKQLKNIYKTVGYMNKEHGFFHGDLKDDNVLVHKKDGNTVLYFDFDFSGVSGKVKNKTILEYWKTSSTIWKKVNSFVEKRSKDSDIFFLIFDAFRLFVSHMFELSKKHRYDTFSRKCSNNTCINEIVVENKYIRFILGDFVDFLNGYAIPNERTLSKVQKRIGRDLKIDKVDWNTTFMHETVISNLIIFIKKRNKRNT
tara:strand:+ start:450 stop:1898 length:1449 start_codon:yes stop_codon:yes gene_type:complete